MLEKKSRPWPATLTVSAPPHRARRVSEVKITPAPAAVAAFQLRDVCAQTGQCRFTLGNELTVEMDLTSGAEFVLSAVNTGELNGNDPAVDRVAQALAKRHNIQGVALKA